MVLHAGEGGDQRRLRVELREAAAVGRAPGGGYGGARARARDPSGTIWFKWSSAPFWVYFL